MPRILCILGLILSGLTALLFLLDLVIAKPFGGHNMTMDIVFLVCSIVVIVLSYLTFRETT
jgi:hypothetical protein